MQCVIDLTHDKECRWCFPASSTTSAWCPVCLCVCVCIQPETISTFKLLNLAWTLWSRNAGCLLPRSESAAPDSRPGAGGGHTEESERPTTLTVLVFFGLFLALNSISPSCPSLALTPGRRTGFSDALRGASYLSLFSSPTRVNGSFCLAAQISCLNTEWDLYPEKGLLFSFQKANWWASQAGVRGG